MIKWLIRQFDDVLHGDKDGDSDNRAMVRMILYLHIWVLPLILSSIGAIRTAWGEHRFVAVFAEHFAAEWLFIFGGPGWFSIVLGGFVGMKIWQRTKRKVISWIVGIAMIFALWGATSALAQSIPGVDWRYEEIVDQWLEAEPEDYDPY